MSDLAILGQRRPKVNSWAHLTGQAKYADDIVLPRMLYGRLLRSTQAHARIKKVDVSRALTHPGVVAVVTGADMPEKMGIMPSTQDETALAARRASSFASPRRSETTRVLFRAQSRTSARSRRPDEAPASASASACARSI